jgi:hypothetical protein
MDELANGTNQEEHPLQQAGMEDQENQQEGLAFQVEGDRVQFGPGFALSVSANQDAQLSQGGAIAVAAGRDMHIEQGGGQVIAVGHDLKLENGAGGYLRVGGEAILDNSMVVASVSQQVDARDSMLGIVLARQVNLGEGSRVLLNTPQAAAMGAMLGAVFGLVSWLLRKK